MGHCYRVELTRYVAEPLYGTEAYRNDTKRYEFPFGKGKEFPTGKKALAAADTFAKSMMDKASTVSLWRLNGGVGTGECLKDDPDSRFAIGLEEFPNDPEQRTEGDAASGCSTIGGKP